MNYSGPGMGGLRAALAAKSDNPPRRTRHLREDFVAAKKRQRLAEPRPSTGCNQNVAVTDNE
jgi:hypothetical protein